MVEVGKRYGKKMVALQTDMNQPLGRCIGNALEVRECLDILAGRANPPDLMEVTLALAEEMLKVAGISDARALLEQKLFDGSALTKFHEMIAAQNGDPDAALPAARHQRPIPSTRTGIIQSIQCDQIGYAVIALGGGRKTASDKIDFAVGFEHPRKIGEHIRTGDPLMIMHYNDETRAAEAERMILEAYRIEDTTPPAQWPLIVERIT
jgi:thymidine phosphorylase